MTTSPDKPAASSSPSRRALLAGAVGGIGAVAAGAIGRASPVRAEGEAIVVGGEYTDATSVTWLRNQANNAGVFRAESDNNGIAVWGISTGGSAVVAESITNYGVYATSNSGVAVGGHNSASDKPAVQGWATLGTGVIGAAGPGIPIAKAKTGVFGYAVQDGASRGVFGRANAGHGVHGQATGGVGVYGAATKGIAIQGSGRVKFGKVSGVATIAAGNTSVLVNPGVNVTSGSFVLLTPRANIGSRGLWFTTNATANTLTIHVSATRTSATKVAWLLLG